MRLDVRAGKRGRRALTYRVDGRRPPEARIATVQVRPASALRRLLWPNLRSQPIFAARPPATYVLRSTAYYANGQFGMASFDALADYPPLATP